ncbi:MAG: IS630 family transposase, partial [Acaryochloridaceae cyanobacterium CSU_3_4]|nr:IS630 family transposase [Acaryochloridaceae cyanobacterium CSU_3_4]
SIRDRQTYYEALDYLTKRLSSMSMNEAIKIHTICLLKYLQSCPEPQTRLLILSDGASYHRSAKVKTFLVQVNGGLPPQDWKITCIRLAPNAPEQNPVEDIWL